MMTSHFLIIIKVLMVELVIQKFVNLEYSIHLFSDFIMMIHQFLLFYDLKIFVKIFKNLFLINMIFLIDNDNPFENEKN